MSTQYICEKCPYILFSFRLDHGLEFYKNILQTTYESKIYLIICNNRDSDWSSPRIDKYIKKDGHDIIVAIKDNPVGYIGVKEVGDDREVKEIIGNNITNFGQVTWLGVLPEYQKQGIAKLLIANAEEWCRNHNKMGFWLCCRERLINFYKHLGLKLIGQYEDNGKTRYLMCKTWIDNFPYQENIY